MQVLGLKRDDITSLFAVIVTFASFCGESSTTVLLTGLMLTIRIYQALSRIWNSRCPIGYLTANYRSYYWAPANNKGWISDPFFFKEKVCIVPFFVWSFVFEDSLKYPLFSVAKK